MKKILTLTACVCVTTLVSATAQAVTTFDANVTPDVIFGGGNLNGSFTVDRDNGVELGLRGKLRHNAVGAPENTFNSNGDGSYTFHAGVAPTQAFPTGVWSIEWSINSNWDSSSTYTLNELTYSLELDSDPGAGVVTIPFDPINGINPNNGMVLWDHSIGDNSTTDATDSIAVDAVDYGSLISAFNVAQNSWKAHWVIPGFDPNAVGVYTHTLVALDNGVPVASTTIDINVIPEPASLALCGLGLAFIAGLRRRRSA